MCQSQSPLGSDPNAKRLALSLTAPQLAFAAALGNVLAALWDSLPGSCNRLYPLPAATSERPHEPEKNSDRLSPD